MRKPDCDCASARREAALSAYHFDFLAEFTETGEFVWVNPGYTRLLGYESGELVGRNGWDNVHPDDLPLVPDLDALRAGATRSMVARIRHRDGSWRWFEGVTVNYETPEGELRRIAIGRDLTEQRRMERQLRQSEGRYRRLAEEGAALVCEVDASGKFLYVNQRYESVLGYPPDSLVGRAGWDLVLREDLPRLRASFIEAASTGTPGYPRFRARHADGSVRWMDGSVVCQEGEDGELRLVCVSHDVTREKELQEERARLESQVRRIERLESLGVLAGGIAHDFNNLLVSVIGHAELALEDLPAGSPVHDSIQGILTAAERATGLAQRMLGLSGRTTLHQARVDLGEVAAETADLLRCALPAHVELRCDLADEPASVYGDRSQLAQVVLNLTTNAIEAIGARPGVVRIRTGIVEHGDSDHPQGYAIGTLGEGPHAFLRVSDDGPGMDPSIVERVFEPYFTTKFAGRGLGLASVLGIVHAHRGRIDLATEVQRGTEFTVLIPTSSGARA
jgi:PAS domain S-box-containing protein